jgi:RHS repeat-associated protein
VLEVRKETSGTEDPDPLEQFIWHPNYIDAPALRFYDAATSGSQAIHYYTYDANYNVTALLSGNTPIERYRYSPYGAVTVLDADFSVDADGKSDIGNSVTFTGRQFDSETGLYYYRNRYYHGQLGNFVSRDPIGYDAGDLNLYRYVSSAPTGLVDPFGTHDWGMPSFSDYCHYLWHPSEMDNALRQGQYGALITSGVSLTLTGGFAAASSLGLSELGTVGLSQLPRQAAIEAWSWALGGGAARYGGSQSLTSPTPSTSAPPWAPNVPPYAPGPFRGSDGASLTPPLSGPFWSLFYNYWPGLPGRN